MFNSDETADRALAFANAVMNSTDSDDTAVDRIYQLAYSRPPTDQERKESIAHWRRMTEIQENIRHKPREYPTKVVRRAVDENTGEPFEFQEQLFVYKDYEPDLEPHEVDARTRGLADVCLVILNSNEFVYIY